MENFIVGLIIVVIIGAAIAYIVKEKKKGAKCIGCPMAGACASKNNGFAEGGCSESCNCHNGSQQ